MPSLFICLSANLVRIHYTAPLNRSSLPSSDWQSVACYILGSREAEGLLIALHTLIDTVETGSGTISQLEASCLIKKSSLTVGLSESKIATSKATE